LIPEEEKGELRDSQEGFPGSWILTVDIFAFKEYIPN
jgi:hypothetical protein